MVGLNRDQPALYKKEAISKIATNSEATISEAKKLANKPGHQATNLVGLWCIVHDGNLLMLLVNLLIQSRARNKCQLRIYVVARINAHVEVVESYQVAITTYVSQRTVDSN